MKCYLLNEQKKEFVVHLAGIITIEDDEASRDTYQKSSLVVCVLVARLARMRASWLGILFTLPSSTGSPIMSFFGLPKEVSTSSQSSLML